MAKRLRDRSKSVKSFSDLLPRKEYLTVWHSQFGHIPEIEKEAELKSPRLFEAIQWFSINTISGLFFVPIHVGAISSISGFDTGDLPLKSMPAIAHWAY